MTLPVTQSAFSRQPTLAHFSDGIRLSPEDRDVLNKIVVEKVKVYPGSC
ncbi:MAG: hypothetical protein GX262_01010, partial [Clostridia bacterium]|nr:hypothetical protein [Clostridia bacterium]